MDLEAYFLYKFLFFYSKITVLGAKKVKFRVLN